MGEPWGENHGDEPWGQVPWLKRTMGTGPLAHKKLYSCVVGSVIYAFHCHYGFHDFLLNGGKGVKVMLDFQNKKLFKLKPEDASIGRENVRQLLIRGEDVIASYVSMRDRVVFTNKRIISINVQGLTGTKKDYTSIPYSRIQM